MILSPAEMRIVELFKIKGRPLSTLEVSQALGVGYAYANHRLWLLEHKGVLKKTSRSKSNKGRVYYHLNEDNEEVKRLCTLRSCCEVFSFRKAGKA